MKRINLNELDTKLNQDEAKAVFDYVVVLMDALSDDELARLEERNPKVFLPFNNIKREDIINHLNELVSLATYLRAEVDILLKESQKQPEIKYTSSERLSDEDKQLLIKILSKYIDDSGMYADENSNNFI